MDAAEVYDPVNARFASVGSMASRRDGAMSALLPDGRVLIAGGWDGNESLASAELFDPVTNNFVPTGGMAKFAVETWL